jgi:predicted AAA+ superfamily ATPase
MYVPRLLSAAFRNAATQFPAVLVTGPRQSGKTTFLRREAGATRAYVSFDDPLERAFAADDPNGFLDRFAAGGVILDEIQYVPGLLPYLKLRIDERRREAGRWLLTGSQQFGLMSNISESLAGRVAILDLLPFSLLERPPANERALAATAWSGGYPEPALFPEKRDLWMRSYLQMYVERDIRQLRNITNLRQFEAFIMVCAARHAQELNAAGIARAVGVTQPTARAWLSALEAAHVVRLAPPFHRNLGKRVIKSPKLYFLDSGLLCTLTRQPSAEAALAGAMGGPIFEGLVFSEAVKAFAAAGRAPDLYHWRSHDGLEVDLVIGLAGRLVPIEVKLTGTPVARHGEPLRRFRELAGSDAAEEALLVCRARTPREMPGGILALPWHEFPRWMWRRLTTDPQPGAGPGRGGGRAR